MSPPDFLLILSAQWLSLALMMALAFAAERRTGNSGYVDVTWSYGVALTAAGFALLPFSSEGAPSSRQMLFAAMILVWGLRLGTHIAARSRNSHDDPRYAELKRVWGPRAGREMFLLLQKQAIVSLPLPFAVFLAAHNPSPALGAQDALAVAIFLLALAGETVADRQLRAFTADPRNAGKICDAGLWRYSRHPNYFFEWLHWLAYPVAAIDLGGAFPAGWLALLAPVTMYWLLVHVSGIPPLETHMLRKHGERYRAYQNRTNAFFPGAMKHV